MTDRMRATATAAAAAVFGYATKAMAHGTHFDCPVLESTPGLSSPAGNAWQLGVLYAMDCNGRLAIHQDVLLRFDHGVVSGEVDGGLAAAGCRAVQLDVWTCGPGQSSGCSPDDPQDYAATCNLALQRLEAGASFACFTEDNPPGFNPGGGEAQAGCVDVTNPCTGQTISVDVAIEVERGLVSGLLPPLPADDCPEVDLDVFAGGCQDRQDRDPPRYSAACTMPLEHRFPRLKCRLSCECSYEVVAQGLCKHSQKQIDRIMRGKVGDRIPLWGEGVRNRAAFGSVGGSLDMDVWNCRGPSFVDSWSMFVDPALCSVLATPAELDAACRARAGDHDCRLTDEGLKRDLDRCIEFGKAACLGDWTEFPRGDNATVHATGATFDPC